MGGSICRLKAQEWGKEKWWLPPEKGKSRLLKMGQRRLRRQNPGWSKESKGGACTFPEFNEDRQ